MLAVSEFMIRIPSHLLYILSNIPIHFHYNDILRYERKEERKRYIYKGIT